MPKTVLIVDSNRKATTTLSIHLTLYGYDVKVATDPGAALIEFGYSRPDVVLVDVGAPSMNGQELARTMRQASGGKHVLFIAASGWHASGNTPLFPDNAFDEYLVKPYSVKELVRLMRSIP